MNQRKAFLETLQLANDKGMGHVDRLTPSTTRNPVTCGCSRLTVPSTPGASAPASIGGDSFTPEGKRTSRRMTRTSPLATHLWVDGKAVNGQEAGA